MKKILYGIGGAFALLVGMNMIGSNGAPPANVSATGSPETRAAASASPAQVPTAVPMVTATPTALSTKVPVSTKTPTAKASATASSCDPNYAGACVPIASDVDCAGGRGDGPAYVRGPVTVIGRDIYGLDGDGDGVGCD